MKLEFSWQSTPQLWMVYEDPEGISGLGKTKEDALAAFVSDLDEDYRRQLDEQSSVISNSHRWIPLTERPPSEEDRYAILYRYKDTKIVRAFVGDYYGAEGWGCDVLDSTITHWMQLPEVPK